MPNGQQLAQNEILTPHWKIIFKTLVALFAAAAVPTFAFFVLELLNIFRLRDFYNIPWTFFFIPITFVIAFMHLLILGLPIFLLGWYFRVIRWWSTLMVAFVIGAVPTAISFSPGLSLGYYSPKLYISMFTAMGLFGFSGGLAFWLLWRYWVNPDSPYGRDKEVSDTKLDEQD
jgi:hypothetical protein